MSDDAIPAIAPPFDWSKRRDYTWLSAAGTQKLREKVSPLLDFELDNFQIECPAQILDGQDVLCIIATGAGKTALIYVPLMVREGTISIVVSPTNFLQRDMVRQLNYFVASMRKKGLSSIAINSDTITATALVSCKRDLWAEAKTGAHRLIFIGPEMMKSPDYQTFISNKNVRARLGQFTVDELHAADEWSVDFRKDFQDIPTMRVRLPDHTTFVGLSASIEPGRQYEACVKLMGFRPGFHLEKQDCERHNVALMMRRILYTSSGLEFHDLDWLVPLWITKASDVPKYLLFVQSIEQGHRIVDYLRTLLPLHLQKDAHRLIRHHHSLACPECKAEGMDSLYKCANDRDCLVHVSTDVLTVGVNIPGLAGVIIYGPISSASALLQRAGRPVRERGTQGSAFIYVTKADMADALAYVNSEAGKQDKRVLELKDPTSHHATAPAEGVVESPEGLETPAGNLEDASAAAASAQPTMSNPPAGNTAASSKKSKKAKKAQETPGVIAKPGQRTCNSLLLIFAAHARDRCITRQINIIYGNPGVDKDCGRCSSCVGDVVPEPRKREVAQDNTDQVNRDPEVEKVPSYMKPLVKDLKAIGEKLENSARTIRWSRAPRPDALLIGTRIFLPPDLINTITADFLSITSEEIFEERVRSWKYANEYGRALWNVVKILVANLRQELVDRHETALEKARNARAHKYVVDAGLTRITRVRLLVKNPATYPINVTTIADVSAEVPAADFYAGSPQKSPAKQLKRKAEELLKPGDSSKRQKKAVRALLSYFFPISACLKKSRRKRISYRQLGRHCLRKLARSPDHC
ncbi:P-loop containing nucleoside triphosphate hydrolase protein [Mycena pura]|uniref:DNA 3'-5' helicase n=1 Tax=Mycena pura TaxID=153505 RepID=A0AAD6Y896_9AGAR|nr:P-loop containing nucleoside triphosphate hydrolase protein [Mycena pura]